MHPGDINLFGDEIVVVQQPFGGRRHLLAITDVLGDNVV